MKTWEMYKIATENTKAMFKRLLLSNDDIYHFNDKGQLRVFDKDYYYPSIKIDEDWELVPREVTWQEAIQAWLNGKDISIEYGGGTFIQKYACRFGVLENQFDGFGAKLFTDGKWYIKE